jgi:hypothetical protein
MKKDIIYCDMIVLQTRNPCYDKAAEYILGVSIRAGGTSAAVAPFGLRVIARRRARRLPEFEERMSANIRRTRRFRKACRD